MAIAEFLSDTPWGFESQRLRAPRGRAVAAIAAALIAASGPSYLAPPAAAPAPAAGWQQAALPAPLSRPSQAWRRAGPQWAPQQPPSIAAAPASGWPAPAPVPPRYRVAIDWRLAGPQWAPQQPPSIATAPASAWPAPASPPPRYRVAMGWRLAGAQWAPPPSLPAAAPSGWHGATNQPPRQISWRAPSGPGGFAFAAPSQPLVPWGWAATPAVAVPAAAVNLVFARPPSQDAPPLPMAAPVVPNFGWDARTSQPHRLRAAVPLGSGVLAPDIPALVLAAERPYVRRVRAISYVRKA